MVITNKKALSGTDHDVETLVEQAEEIILETSDEGGIYQHIMDEAGLGIEREKDKNGEEIEDGEKYVVELSEDDSVQEIIQKVEVDKEKKAKQNRKEQGKELTDAKSVKKMKRELFSDRLEFTKATIKTGSAPIVSTIGGFTTAGLYAGAAGDMNALKVYGAATVGSAAASKVRDLAVDTPINIVDEVTNRASGIGDAVQNGGKDAKNVLGKAWQKGKAIGSAAIFGDDNEQGVTTRHMDTAKKDDPKVQEEAFQMERIEKRKAAVERSMRNRERFLENIEIQTRRNRRENSFDELNARITSNITRPNLNPENVRRNASGNARNATNPINPLNPLNPRNAGAAGNNPPNTGNGGSNPTNPNNTNT